MAMPAMLIKLTLSLLAEKLPSEATNAAIEEDSDAIDDDEDLSFDAYEKQIENALFLK